MRRIKLARFLQRISDVLPRRYPLRSSSDLQLQPFFIFGSGRNGSTLLNRMLNQHSQLFLPSEQYFLGNSIIKFKLYNFLIWRDLVKIIAGELVQSTGSHTWDFGPEKLLPTLFETDDRSLQKLIDTIYRAYGENHGPVTMWGDSTPLNTRYAQEIFSVFPKAKYIFLLRDGRDVSASYKAAGEEFLGELANPKKAIEHWKKSIHQYRWLEKRTDVLLVKYEDLVTDPEKVLGEICDFLGLNLEERMFHHHEHQPSSQMYQEPQHANIFKPVSMGSIGNWEEVLDEKEKTGMENYRSLLSQFGYL